MRIIRIICLLLVLLGWIVANAEFLPIINNHFLSQYTKALTGYKKISQISLSMTLSKADVGFKEIIRVLRNELQQNNIKLDKGVDITKISLLNRNMTEDQLMLRLDLSNNTYGTLGVENLKQKLKKDYLEKKYFKFGSVIFWFGYIGSFSILAYELRRENRKGSVLSE